MKTLFHAGVAAFLLASAMPAAAIPADAPPADAASAPQRPITFGAVMAAANKAWDKLDANHDGRIDQIDHDARLVERFDKWDLNHDGMISKDEFLAHVHADEARTHDAMGEGHRPGGTVMMAIITPAMDDARKSGVVERAAFDAAVKSRFDALDANHDGMLTREEMHAAMHGMRGHGPGRDGDMPPPPPTDAP